MRGSWSPTRPSTRWRSSARSFPRDPSERGSGSACCRCSGSTRRHRRNGRSCSPPGAGSWSTSPRSGRRCSCSKTSTGPTRRCSPSSSTWPTWPRACRCCSSAPPGPSCSSATPSYAAGLRNANTINLAPLLPEETARLVSALLEATVAARRVAAADPRPGRRQPALRRGVRAVAEGPRPARQEGRDLGARAKAPRCRCPSPCRR